MDTFEAAAQASTRARSWAKRVGGGIMGLGLVAMLNLSFAAGGTTTRSQKEGVYVAAAALVIAIALAITGARAAFDIVTANALPEKARSTALGRAIASIAAIPVITGLGVLAFSILYGMDDSYRKPEVGYFELVASVTLASFIARWVARSGQKEMEDPALADLRADARKDEGVQDALAEIRRNTMRRWGARIASLVAGGATIYGGIEITNVVYDELPRSQQPGLMFFFGIVAAGVVVALMVSKRLMPSEGDDVFFGGDIPETGGIFDETLATTSSLMVRQEQTLAGILFGDAAGQKFDLIDGAGAWCGRAKEESNLFTRLFFTARRPLDIVVDDLGEAALRVTRPFVLLREQAAVSAGDRQIGRIQRTWSPLRSVYQITNAEGRDTLSLVSGWIFKSRFRVMQNGAEVGELRRLRKPWYVRMFRSSLIPEQDRFGLTFPPAADMDERRLLVGALFLVDASA